MPPHLHLKFDEDGCIEMPEVTSYRDVLALPDQLQSGIFRLISEPFGLSPEILIFQQSGEQFPLFKDQPLFPEKSHCQTTARLLTKRSRKFWLIQHLKWRLNKQLWPPKFLQGETE